TVAALEAFGVTVEREGDSTFRAGRQRSTPARVAIEGDHSSASYLFAAAAIVGGEVRVRGLRRESLQPDARFLRDLADLGSSGGETGGRVTMRASGRIPGFAWDLRDAPDLAPTACALAVCAEGPSRLEGLHNLAYKESDRLVVLAENARRLGASAS